MKIKNIQKGFSSLVLIVVFVLLGGGLFYAGYQYSQKQTSSVPQPTPSLTTSPASTGTDETANWKTYINQDNRYSLKYPSGWTVYEVPEGPEAGRRISFFDPAQPEYKISLLVSSNNKGVTTQEWINSLVAGFDEPIRTNLKLEVTNVQVGSLSGKSVIGLPGGPGSFVSWFFLSGMKVYEFTAIPYDPQNPAMTASSERILTLLRSIVSTLQF